MIETSYNEAPGGPEAGLRQGLARAVERVLAGLATQDVARAVEAAHRSRNLGELQFALTGLGAWSVRHRQLQADDIQRLARSDAGVLVRLNNGWLALRAGRAFLVDAVGEVRTTRGRTLRRFLGTAPLETLIVEPNLPLGELASAGEGSAPSPWERLRSLIRLERPSVVALTVYAVMVGGLSLAVPVAVQVLVNTIAFGSLLQPLVVLSIMLLCVLLFAAGVQLMQWYATEVLARRLFVRLAEDFTRRLCQLELQSHGRYDTRELIHRFFEVSTLQKTVSQLLIDGVGLALQTLLGLLLLAFYHPVLLIFDALLVVSLGIVLALGYGGVASATRESKSKYQVAAWLGAIASRPALFGGPAGARFAAVRADGLTHTYLANRRSHFRVLLRQLAGGLTVQVTALVALLALGGYLVLQGELTLGQLVAAELVVGAVGTGFAKLGKHFEAGYDLLAGLDKVGKVLDVPLLSENSQVPATTVGPVRLRAAKLRANGEKSAVLDLELPERGRLELCLDDAESERAFLHVLCGLRRPTGGVLELHAPARRPLGTHELRTMSLLISDHDIIPGSILDNLRVVHPELGEQEAWQALRAVGLETRVAELPDGLHTHVLSEGLPLTPTEALLLCFARVFARRPAILAIDGALDGLRLPRERLDALLGGLLGPEAPWTAVARSHDPRIQAWLQRYPALPEASSAENP